MVWTDAHNIISLLKKRFGLEEEFFTIHKAWTDEIGITEAKITGYKNGVIFIKTISSVISYELMLRKKEIIKKLNQYVGIAKIKNIKIKIEE
jgi:hypothetical protein